MSFDNFYPNRKDHRKAYRGSARWDRGCRNGGSCGWCENNRTFANRRREPLDETTQYYKKSTIPNHFWHDRRDFTS